ncbi:MAG: SDR family oxidoreductase [Xanthomonadales bacterium]|nr:SDR family oxidoreductase [Xanthomonadales bacterium]
MPTILITGANRGLGLGLTRAYLQDGFQVITASRHSSPELEALQNARLRIFQVDLTNDDALRELADELSGSDIDILVNNAGTMAKPPGAESEQGVQGFGHFDRDLWRELFDINLFTPMRLAELFVEQLARSPHGRIVTISSSLGSMGMNEYGGLYAYRASKAGVNAIMKSMSLDLAERGVIAVPLNPGWVKTRVGGPDAPMEVEESVAGMKRVIDGLQPSDSGRFWSWDGSELPW